jgi:hypothetical protein
MPGTNEEWLARSVNPDGIQVEPMFWNDGTEITQEEVRTLLRMRCYFLRERRVKQRKPQRIAHRLLRSLLTPEQRKHLKNQRYFLIQGSSGGVYRLMPRIGRVERVMKRGKNWYSDWIYCLHDEQDDDEMPPADLTIAHMLLILADEAEFLEKANSTRATNQQWDGEWRRTLNRNRRNRINAIVETADPEQQWQEMLDAAEQSLTEGREVG